MKVKNNICESCGVNHSKTHLHHILPVSKGGLDVKENLIEVCPPCHQKIHNTQFNGDSGLISEGIKKSKQEERNAIFFMKNNSDSLFMFFEDFSDIHDTSILHDMLRFGVLSALDFVRMIKGEQTRAYYGDISKLVSDLYKSSNIKYNFIFKD